MTHRTRSDPMYAVDKPSIPKKQKRNPKVTLLFLVANYKASILRPGEARFRKRATSPINSNPRASDVTVDGSGTGAVGTPATFTPGVVPNENVALVMVV